MRWFKRNISSHRIEPMQIVAKVYAASNRCDKLEYVEVIDDESSVRSVVIAPVEK